MNEWKLVHHVPKCLNSWNDPLFSTSWNHWPTIEPFWKHCWPILKPISKISSHKLLQIWMKLFSLEFIYWARGLLSFFEKFKRETKRLKEEGGAVQKTKGNPFIGFFQQNERNHVCPWHFPSQSPTIATQLISLWKPKHQWLFNSTFNRLFPSFCFKQRRKCVFVKPKKLLNSLSFGPFQPTLKVPFFLVVIQNEPVDFFFKRSFQLFLSLNQWPQGNIIEKVLRGE